MNTKSLFLLLLLPLLFFSTAKAQKTVWEEFFSLEENKPTDHYNDTNYLAQWLQVDSLEGINMLRNADSVVKLIHQQAWKAKNYPVVIKAILFELKYQNNVKEVGIDNQLKQLDAEIEKMPSPHKNVLQSIAGSAWLMAYQNRNYDDEQQEPDTANPANWDIDKLVKKAEAYFIASLQNSEALLQIPIKNYTTLAFVPNNAENLWPTVYDLLQWRAFRFYSAQVGSHGVETGYNKEVVFSDVTDFLKLNFNQNTTQDKSLRLLQSLLQRYTGKSLTTALVTADIERVEYLSKISLNIDQKDSLELVWLESQIQKYKQHPITALLLYKAARKVACTNSYYYTSDIGDGCNNSKALRYCQWAVDSFPAENASYNCKGLMQEIYKPLLSASIEYSNIAKEPFRYNLNYKNVKQAFVKFIAISEDTLGVLETQFRDNSQEFINALLSHNIITSQTVDLPVDTNYTGTATQWYHKGLPQGHYAILVSAQADFSADSTITMFKGFWSSDYTVYSTKTENDKHTYFVGNVKNNTPLKGAKVVLSYYDYGSAYNERKKVLLEAITDKNGIVIADINESMSVNVEVYYKGKKIVSSKGSTYVSNYNYNSSNLNNVNTYFFTDRGIYRPGQTLYLKGIMVQSGENEKDAQLLKNKTTTITLEDANGDVVATQEFTTNNFGSFSGSFVLPYGRITGYYSLHDKYGSESFLVEEYKRPKFEVIFDTLKTNPSFNDTVVISGKANAFAGNALNGATMVYKVSRKVNYMYYRWSEYGYGNEEEAKELKTDSVLLNDDGTFSFSFVAIAGNKPNNNYTYNIEAVVTDITGETQEGNQSITIGKRTVFVELNASSEAFAQNEVPIHLTAKNLNNKQVPLQGTLTIKTLQTPETIFSEDYLESPDTQLIDLKTYKKLFPQFALNREDYRANFPVGETVFTKTINNQSGSETIQWQGGKQASGLYAIEFVYTDNLGKTHTETTYTTLLNTRIKKAFSHSNFVLVSEKSEYQPSETATVILSSRFPKTRVIYYVERQGKIGEMQQIKLNNKQYAIKIPIEEADRGGIHITAFTVYNNRFYQENITLHVPYTNKELNVEITTYRDKMLPGNKEEWQLKISGADAKAVSAEILASMYDESLDKIYSSAWGDFAASYRPYRYRLVNTSQHAFGSIQLKQINSLRYVRQQSYIQRYPKLYFFKWMPDLLYQTIYNWEDNDTYYDSDYDYEGLTGLGNSGSGSGGGGAGEGFGSGHGGGKASGWSISKPEQGGVAMMEGRFNSSADIQEKRLYENDMGEAPNAIAGMDLQGFSPAQFIKVRRNLDETAFFFAHQQTGDSGNVIIKFIAPEALTRWKFKAYAHTQDLSSGYASISSITQKPLMVQTNMPRFLREGDEIYINAKIVNLSDEELSPNAVLEVYDAATGKNLPEFNNTNMVQVPQLASGVSQSVKWKFKVPAGYGALKIIIKTFEGKYTDAEANTIPILSNKILVTEALPITFSGDKAKTYTLEKLAKNNSSTLTQHKLTVEFTANPAWYAIQALPYMMEYPNECAEQVFNRYYVNTIAQYIANSQPKIREVFDSWKNATQQGEENPLQSALEKNEELKSLLLQETPWLAEGKTETQRKQRLGLLFDDNNMDNQRQIAINKLLQMQMDNGAFPWFGGMRENLSITQYIVAGLGKVNQLTEQENTGTAEMLNSLQYMHQQAEKEYTKVKDKADKNHLSFTQAQYLYAISFYVEIDNSAFEKYEESIIFWKQQAATYWARAGRMEQAMIAIALHRLGDEHTPKIIIKSLQQTALKNIENGMYWKERTGGFSWTDAPIETHALIIEAFSLIDADNSDINLMRTWLLKQKQLSDWKTTRATADACYALLLNGDNWLENTASPTITVGTKTINNDPEVKTEVGTGYIKQSFTKEEIQPAMGTVSISPQSGTNVPMAWGGLYWQYFEQLDKITYAQTPLALIKQLFVEHNTDSGTVSQPLNGQKLKAGDKITVRIFLKANNDMDFVHLKDMRAAALEPTQSLSGYQWQNGVGYYQSIRDASMNFFFDKLPKGQWVFEYSLRVSQAGTFQNGIATVQSMYAPQYTSHSSGVTITVEP